MTMDILSPHDITTLDRSAYRLPTAGLCAMVIRQWRREEESQLLVRAGA